MLAIFWTTISYLVISATIGEYHKLHFPNPCFIIYWLFIDFWIDVQCIIIIYELISFHSYLGHWVYYLLTFPFALLFNCTSGSCVVRDASGLNESFIPTVLQGECSGVACNYNWNFTECIANNTCPYGLINNYQVIKMLIECCFVNNLSLESYGAWQKQLFLLDIL